MPLPVITATVRAAVRGTCPSGQPWINALHFVLSAGSWDATNIGLLHTGLTKLYTGTAYASGVKLLGNAPSTCTVQDVVYTPLDGSSASTVTTLAGSGAGLAADAMPPEVSAVVTFRTTVRGRSRRGRVYLPPYTRGVLASGGILDPTVISALIAEWAGFNADMLTHSIVHSVASYKLGLCTPISSYTMDNKLDVQRRRK